jgi:hypothetical protein
MNVAARVGKMMNEILIAIYIAGGALLAFGFICAVFFPYRGGSGG